MTTISTNPATLRRVTVPNTRFDKMVTNRLKKLSGNMNEAYRITDPSRSIGMPLPHYTLTPTNDGAVYIRA